MSALNCIPLPYLLLHRILEGSESINIDVLIGLGIFSYGMLGVCVDSTRHQRPPRRDANDAPENRPTTHGDSLNIYHAKASRWGHLKLLASAFTFFSWYLLPLPLPFRQPLRVQSLLSSPLFQDFASDSFLLPQSAITRHCKRRPLISHQYISHESRPDDKETYAHLVGSAFEDTLLIVFFSHARYDVNLDSYLEMYTPYFPNVRISFSREVETLSECLTQKIIFVGPGSREDRGFNRSYDVVVDTSVLSLAEGPLALILSSQLSFTRRSQRRQQLSDGRQGLLCYSPHFPPSPVVLIAA